MANWGKISERGNIDDRRGTRIAGGITKIGIPGVVALLTIGYFMGPDAAFQILNQVQNNGGNQTTVVTPNSEQFEGEDSYERFASTVLGSNNAFWTGILSGGNLVYRAPKLVLFRQATNSGCGGAVSEIGPHYCPIDETIYLDETFFEELSKRYGAKGGDVAEAYVISHEVGHHVQEILGLHASLPRTNQNSIKTELQADCFAGFWAGTIAGKGILEKNEISEAIDAAGAVGDDRIQKKATGRISPESWTHGSSQERKMWFIRGFESETLASCDTFG